MPNIIRKLTPKDDEELNIWKLKWNPVWHMDRWRTEIINAIKPLTQKYERDWINALITYNSDFIKRNKSYQEEKIKEQKTIFIRNITTLKSQIAVLEQQKNIDESWFNELKEKWEEVKQEENHGNK